MARNPIIAGIEPKEGLFGRSPLAKRKVDPLAKLPWRMFEEFGNRKCQGCPGQIYQEVFTLAKNRDKADKIFSRDLGICSEHMAQALVINSRRLRIATTDGARPNPVTSQVEMPSAARPTVISVSPYKVFGFTPRKPVKDACGKTVQQLFVIATTREEAQSLLHTHGQCATCILELLTLPRYTIQTSDGQAP